MPDILEIAKTAARRAGEAIKASRNGKVEQKASNNLLSEADLRAQQAIADTVLEAFPDHAVLGEEGNIGALDEAKHIWVVDPLDGTNNFVHGIPIYSCSVAYAFEGEVRAGVVLDPERDEMFWAHSGGGAFLNGASIVPSEARALEDVITSFGFYYDRGEVMRYTLGTVQRLLEANIRGIRRTGSAALDCCWVGCGRLQEFFEYRLSPWDFSAGAFIAREAGARVTSASGGALGLEPASVVLTAPGVYDAFFEIVKREGA